jgi:hypothetical protein
MDLTFARSRPLSRGPKSQKVAEGRKKKKKKMSCMNQSFTNISNNFDEVAQNLQTKVADGRTKLRNVACNSGNLQVQYKQKAQQSEAPIPRFKARQVSTAHSGAAPLKTTIQT